MQSISLALQIPAWLRNLIISSTIFVNFCKDSDFKDFVFFVQCLEQKLVHITKR